MVTQLAQELAAGTVVGARYRIERLLGEGGFASVYLARHVELETPVAVKRMHPQHLTRDDLQSRFRAEARTAATLESRHTVRVRDFGFDDDGAPFMAMDLVRGPTLEAMLAARGTLDEDVVAGVALGVLASLGEAAEHGVIHRDIKPANIFLAEERARGRIIAKVSDFGIAKLLHAGADSATRTVDGIMCTPLYAAPEMLRREAVPTSDLYALGHVMAELLDGTAPYAGDNAIVSAAMHLGSDPVPLGPRARASRLGPIIARALEKRPAARFGSAAEMAEAIHRVYAAAGQSISAEMAKGVLAGTRDMAAASPRPTDHLQPAPQTPTAVAAGGVVGPAAVVRDDVDTNPLPARSASAPGASQPHAEAARFRAEQEFSATALDNAETAWVPVVDPARTRLHVISGMVALLAVLALAGLLLARRANAPDAAPDPGLVEAPAPGVGTSAPTAPGAGSTGALESNHGAPPADMLVAETVPPMEGSATVGDTGAGVVEAQPVGPQAPRATDTRGGHDGRADRDARDPGSAASTPNPGVMAPSLSHRDATDRMAAPEAPAEEPTPRTTRSVRSSTPAPRPGDAGSAASQVPPDAPARTIRTRAPLQLDTP